jgi:hypothetical protein
MDPYLLAKFLHILSAALWLVITYALGQRARVLSDTITLPAKAYVLAEPLIGVIVLASGTWLIEQLGGWAEMPPLLQVGAHLTIVILVIGAGPVWLGWRRLAKARAAGATLDAQRSIARRIGHWTHLAQLLWVVVLACMVFRFA